MSKTARRTWQIGESRVARMFGAERNVGSGSMGRKDLTASDSTHPILFIETKHKAKSAVRTLYDGTAKKAKKEKKIPLVVQLDKNRPGTLITLMIDDLPAVAAEYAKARLAELKELPGQTKFIDEDERCD